MTLPVTIAAAEKMKVSPEKKLTMPESERG